MSAVTDQRIEKWMRWIDETITNNVSITYDVSSMLLRREAWLEVASILQRNGQLPDSYWWKFMRDTYVDTQAVAVRRQADTHRDAASLGKLIQQIRDDPVKLTCEWWLTLWDTPANEVDRLFAEGKWAEEFGGSIGRHLDPAIPAADLESLIAASANVKAYVDKYVAHADPSAASTKITLTLQEIHDAIDVIGQCFHRYYLLFTASDIGILVPVIQHDWQAVFRTPWIRSGTD
jgi:hypothetical protein